MLDKQHDIRVLNSLLETVIDSIDGYRRSAQEAVNGRFASAFLERANEREEVAEKLRAEVRRLGGTPEEDGSILAAAHRAFLGLRDTVTENDDKAVVAEVDHGETYLDEKWRTALENEKLQPETRRVIAGCYESIRSGRDEWRAIHENLSHTS